MKTKAKVIVAAVGVYLVGAVATYNVAVRCEVTPPPAAFIGALWPVFWLDVLGNSGGEQ